MGAPSGCWPSRWPAEDAGPRRLQAPHEGPALDLASGGELAVASRLALASTMVVLREPGQAYLLCHTGGGEAISWVERFHPETLEVIERSPDLPAGPAWPGGLAAHADGSLHVVFGRWAHRLAADCSLLASRVLPRNRPYNSFVTLPDGHLVTKDFGGALPPGTEADPIAPAELLVLEPAGLEIVARLELPEPSVARLSAAGDDAYVVGDTALHRVRWDGTALVRDEAFSAVYRTLPGQTYGWDAVITEDAAWFLDDGEGTEGYAGSLRGCGRSGVPLHLVRVDLASGAVTLTEVSGLPGGIVANPPVVDEGRGIVVAYDSGNGKVAAFRTADLTTQAAADAAVPIWRADLDHGGHPLLFPSTGELLLGHHDVDGEHLVVVDIATGEELGRIATGSPVQSVLFPAAGFGRDAYLCTFTTLSRAYVS